MLTLTIDNQTVQAPEGSTVLQAIRHVGVRFPTLCYWEGLPPYSACRLCIVEMIAPRHLTIPACSYPAEDGLVIATDGPRAVAMRKMMLEFMLARCPNSPVIRSLADEAGVTETRFPLNPNRDELCILCGLCVRVCRDLVGAAALAFIGRGSERKVGSPFGLPAEARIGCGACAAVCPTGAVKMQEVDGKRVLTTWHTEVPLQPCPACGRPFTPEPMGFVREHVPDIDHVWGLCPACRRQATVGG